MAADELFLCCCVLDCDLTCTHPLLLGLQVLDRVLAKVGGRLWWGTLGGRVKAQRAYRLAAGGDASKVCPPAWNLTSYSLARCKQRSCNSLQLAPW